MVWPRPGDKPFTEPMVVKLLRRIYVSLGLDELMLVWFISQKETVGHYSLSGKTFYRQISCSLEAARLDIMIVPLWNLTSITAALLLMCLSNPSERLEKSQPESGGGGRYWKSLNLNRGGGVRCEGWKIDLCSNFDCVVTCRHSTYLHDLAVERSCCHVLIHSQTSTVRCWSLGVDFIIHFTGFVITYPSWDQIQSMLVKEVPVVCKSYE